MPSWTLVWPRPSLVWSRNKSPQRAGYNADMSSPDSRVIRRGLRIRLLVLVPLGILAIVMLLPDADAPTAPENVRTAGLEPKEAPIAEADPEEVASESEGLEDPPPSSQAGLLVKIYVGGDVDVSGAQIEVVPQRCARREDVTNADGCARLNLPPDLDAVVIARLKGYMRAHQTVSLDAGSVRKVTLFPREIVTVAGTVRGKTDGCPVAGATVRSYHDSFVRHPWCGTAVEHRNVPPLGRAVTDGQGSFAVPVEKDRGLVTVAAQAPWYRPGHVTRFDGDDDWSKAWDLLLEPASALRGTVFDPDGKPVPGARVLAVARNDFDLDSKRPLAGINLDRAELEEGWYTGYEEAWKTLRTRCDDAGRFVLHGLVPGGVYHAWSISKGLAASEPAADITAPAPGRTVDRDFRLRRSASLQVTARNAEVRPPTVTSARLRTDGRELIAGADGRDSMLFAPLAPGTYVLDLSAQGYRPIRRELALAEGEHRVLELVLDVGASISGVAVDDIGEPVVDAEIRFEWNETERPLDKGESESEGEARTDANGRFHVSGLREGPHVVDVSGDEAALSEAPVEVPQEGVRIVVPRRGGFRFRLAHPNRTDEEVLLRHFLNYVDGGGTGSTTEFEQDEPLVYESTGHSTGRVRFEAMVPGYVPFGWAFRIEPGRVLDLGTVKLNAGVVLKGVVHDQDGEPFENLRITASGDAWGDDYPVEVWSDTAGRFRLSPLPKTRVRIRATWGRKLLYETTLDPGDAPGPVKWTVPRPSRLLARIKDEGGLPLTGISLRAHGLDGARNVIWDAEYRSGDEGRIFMILAPGRYSLELVRDGKKLPAGELRIAPGEKIERTFVVPAK